MTVRHDLSTSTPRDELLDLARQHGWTVDTFPGSMLDTLTRGPAGPEQPCILLIWWEGDKRLSSASMRSGGPEGRGVGVAHPQRRMNEARGWITAPGEPEEQAVMQARADRRVARGNR